MAKLILIRHGQSLWNAANKFTGWVDVPLSKHGRAEATIAACKLKDYRIQVCFTSLLFRAIVMYLENISETEIINIELGTAIPIVYDIDAHGSVANKIILN